MKQTKFTLSEKEMPTSWYNILPDLPAPLPPELHPGTKEPTILPPPLFPSAMIEQEFSQERYIEIPEEVQEVYHTWRPTRLHRAHRAARAAVGGGDPQRPQRRAAGSAVFSRDGRRAGPD